MRRAQRRHMQRIEGLRPRTAAELHRFVRVALGLDVPREPVSDDGCAPFAYLLHTFFEAGESRSSLRSERAWGQGTPPGWGQGTAGGWGQASGDCVVWANRGGGKTLLGAVATLLDLIFKPGIQVRILGGSLEQSSRMHAHLVSLCERPLVRPLLASEPTQRRVALVNASVAEVLAQSQRSVRGVRVHKLRCDEVEQFDPDVWAAAQLVTRSGWCGDVWVQGAVEALSTMHRPGGLMARLVEGDGSSQVGGGRWRVFRWSFLDVIERCAAERACEPCVLWSDCRGRAKHAGGFMQVDDLVSQWQRSSREAWAAEMACRRPRRSDSVYPNFDPDRHVQPTAGQTGTLIGGMDFGLRSPLVMLWARLEGEAGDASPAGQRLHVVDEYVEEGLTLEQHLAAIARRGHDAPTWVGVDPAGRQRNSHSGLSDIDVLRAHGHRVRAQRSKLEEGIERVRRRLDRGTLLIHPRCVKLIAALRGYHFDVERPHRTEPVKDGPDHACDALRYMIVNLERGPAALRVRRYA